MAKRPIITRNQQIAVAKRSRMAELEVQYLRAKGYEKSPQFQEDQIRALAKIRAITRMGTLPESEAFQIIGRLQQILLDTYQHEMVILEYEQLRKSLQEMFPE